MSFSLRGYYRIVRPLNVLLAAASIFIGAVMAGPITHFAKVIIACTSGALILAAGNVINDYYDIAIDSVNKPHRPIIAGLLSRQTAMSYAIILFTFGVFLSIFISLLSFILAIVVSGCLYVYSRSLKQTVLWGNIAVSSCSALAFIYGGLAATDPSGALIPAVFAFFFHLGREIIKDIEDVEADRVNSVRTLPVCFGNCRALAIASSIFVFLIVLTTLPFLFGIYGEAYLLVVLFGVDTILIFSLITLWKNPLPETSRRISVILKIDMFVGLFAILIGVPGRAVLL